MPQVVVLHEEHKKYVSKMTALAIGAGVLALVVIFVAINLVWAAQHSDAIKKAKALDKAGKTADEIQLLQQYVGTNPPKQYQPDALELLGDADSKAGKNNAAYEAYLRADTLSSKPARELKEKVANMAAATGDKATAISYYKQALTLTAASDNVKISVYQDQIRSLGGTP